MGWGFAIPAVASVVGGILGKKGKDKEAKETWERSEAAKRKTQQEIDARHRAAYDARMKRWNTSTRPFLIAQMRAGGMNVPDTWGTGMEYSPLVSNVPGASPEPTGTSMSSFLGSALKSGASGLADSMSNQMTMEEIEKMLSAAGATNTGASDRVIGKKV